MKESLTAEILDPLPVVPALTFNDTEMQDMMTTLQMQDLIPLPSLLTSRIGNTEKSLENSNTDQRVKQQKPRFCSQCGNPRSETASFCPYCGTQLVERTSPEQSSGPVLISFKQPSVSSNPETPQGTGQSLPYSLISGRP
jgi:hypothetical protein